MKVDQEQTQIKVTKTVAKNENDPNSNLNSTVSNKYEDSEENILFENMGMGIGAFGGASKLQIRRI